MPTGTTGSQGENKGRTGQHLSVTGSDLPLPGITGMHALPERLLPMVRLVTRLPPYLTQIVNEHEMLWIDYISSVKGTNATEDLRQVPQIVAEELGGKAEMLRSMLATPAAERLVDWLTKLASVFTAPLPDTEGLLLYIDALQGQSEIALREGIKQIIKVHRWPRLPFPAELIECCEGPNRTHFLIADRFTKAVNRLPH